MKSRLRRYNSIQIYQSIVPGGRYWQNNMNNVKANKSAHKESVRGLR